MTPEPRSKTSIIEAQRRVLGDADVQRAMRSLLVERHERGNGRHDPGSGRDFGILELTDRDVPLFVVRDDILVRAEQAEAAGSELARLGVDFTGPHAIDCGCDVVLPVVRFELANVDLPVIENAVRELHKKSIDASFNHVYPDAGIKGGQGTAALVPPSETIPQYDDGRKDVGCGVTVAVIDTGLWGKAANRTDRWLDGIPVATGDVDDLDEQGSPTGLDAGAGHGTFVTGIVRQVAPGAEVKIYKALDTDGIGSEQGIACAILRAWRDGANIINLSLGQESFDDHPPVALAAALELIPNDVIVVAAAGNLGEQDVANEAVATRPHWPAAFRQVVGVAALDEAGNPAPWSKRGSWVDVSTVGEGIVSTFVAGKEEAGVAAPEQPDEWTGTDPWAMWLGTSFAAPQIAGLVAAGTTPAATRRRLKPRQALANLLAASTVSKPNYGQVITSPLP